MTFYRSRAADCDLSAITKCANGNSDVLIGAETVVDTAATLEQIGYYTLRNSSNKQAATSVSREKFSARHDYRVTVFNNKLYLIGGVDDSYKTKNDVWSSTDGASWTKVETKGTVDAGTMFSARNGHTVTVFDNKLYLIGGVDDSYKSKNDVWSSTDGASWTKVETKGTVDAGTMFSARNGHQLTVFKNMLYLIGGRGDNYNNDVWSSTDGASWTKVETKGTVDAGTMFSARNGHQLTVFKNKLYLIGGVDDSYKSKNDVWSSTDGASWTKVETEGTVEAGTMFSARNRHQLTVFKNMLYLIGSNDGSNKNDVWSSTDGTSWTQLKEAAEFRKNGGYQVTVFNNKLYLIDDNGGSKKNDVWSSEDGITWAPVTNGAAFPGRWLHQVTVFNSKLYLIGGAESSDKNDVWSSADGASWTQVETEGTVEAGTMFSARNGHQLTVFKNMLYLIGGYDNSYKNKNDVWSSTNGTSWKKVETKGTVDAGTMFSARNGHQLTVFKNMLYLIGGSDDSNKNDVWSSTDGESWTKVKTKGTVEAETMFSARYGHQVTVFNNKLYLIGGRDGSSKNDVWSSTDGASWTKVETKGTVEAETMFSARYGHQVTVFKNMLYLIGGALYRMNNDVWSSTDGESWTQLTAGAQFSARYGHQVTVFNNKLYLIGGYDDAAFYNDVWSLTDGSDWRLGFNGTFYFH